VDAQDLTTYTVGAVALLVGAAALLTRRDRTSFGLRPTGPGGGLLGQLGRGLGLGLVGLVVLWLVVVLTGLGDPGPGGGRSGLVATLGVGAFFAVVFLVEEVVFRGIGTGGLAAWIGLWPATVVVNVAVAAAYSFNDAAGPLAVASQVLSNLVLGAARVRTGRIWTGLALKVGWNVGMLGLGWPDAAYRIGEPLVGMRLDGPTWLTGGDFGAEAGLVGIAVLVALLLAVRRAPAAPRVS
jgi:membrane protease YdiL (CAAX protease family)